MKVKRIEDYNSFPVNRVKKVGAWFSGSLPAIKDTSSVSCWDHPNSDKQKLGYVLERM